jgi:hypothetical protein
MDDAQRKQFTEKGYFIISDCVSKEQLTTLNRLYDSRLEQALGSSQPPPMRPDGTPLAWHGFAEQSPVRMWGQPYYDLVAPPKVVPILQELLGDQAHRHGPVFSAADDPERRELLRTRFRLDHLNIHFSPPFVPELVPDYSAGDAERKKEYWSPHGLVRGGLHDGARIGSTDEPGHNATRLITCMYELLPVALGCGGTVFLPGSHRPDAPQWACDSGTRARYHRPPWPDHLGLQTVQLAPGDCLVFTEKVLHATAPYTGSTQRRTLFYKYLPYGIERDDVPERKYYDLTVPGLSLEQRLILGWPEEWLEEHITRRSKSKM